ncbi:MAG TPA: hypothetical protein DEG71_07230 [Clostridiales bacterium]|nr:hypothetical protein [Clostridiales bacterium]
MIKTKLCKCGCREAVSQAYRQYDYYEIIKNEENHVASFMESIDADDSERLKLFCTNCGEELPVEIIHERRING